MSGDGFQSIGRRLSTWRRLLLIFGPHSAKRVGLALSEFAWASDLDPDGDIIVEHCPQEILRQLCDYGTARGLQIQLKKLEETGWIDRDAMQTGPGIHREYALQVPATVPPAAVAELKHPSPGMWKRLLQVHTQTTPEPEFTCSSRLECENTGTQVRLIDDSNRKHRNSSDISSELERHITGTPATYQANSGSPLKESLRSSSKDLGKAQAAKRNANETRRSRHVPADFHVTTDLLKFALNLGLDQTTIAAETEKFRDHEFDKPKTDWVGTWRNWIRKAIEFRQANNQSETVETTITLAAKLGLEQRADESDARFEKRVCDVDVAQRYPKG